MLSVSLNELYDQKPERFTEGSLLSKMESQQIGTKATRAETISNLIIRKYLTKSKRELVPTETAFNLIDILTEKSPEIISCTDDQRFREKTRSNPHLKGR